MLKQVIAQTDEEKVAALREFRSRLQTIARMHEEYITDHLTRAPGEPNPADPHDARWIAHKVCAEVFREHGHRTGVALTDMAMAAANLKHEIRGYRFVAHSNPALGGQEGERLAFEVYDAAIMMIDAAQLF